VENRVQIAAVLRVVLVIVGDCRGAGTEKRGLTCGSGLAPAGGTEEMQAPAPTFAVDIRPLFRERDRRSMTFLFDLWDYEAVKSNADAILRATAGGDMPCDGAWPVERVDLLRRWIEGGCQP
jgi:hypothetical protein